MSWRVITDLTKRSPFLLRVADRLGRSRGRLRPLGGYASLPSPPHRLDFSNWASHRLAAGFVGHATLVIRVAGRNVLTDPVFSARVGLGFGPLTLGPRRLLAPACRLEELPPIDLILLTHAHFDHLDRPTLARLSKSIPIICARGTADLVRDLGFRQVHELHWAESTRAGPLTIAAREVNHWGARTFFDRHRGFNAYVIEGGTHRVLFAGDTANTPLFRGVGPVDLAIFGIGAYDPYIAAHATPEQAYQMAIDAQARRLLPIHHSTFRLSHEAMDEPIRRLLAAAEPNGPELVATSVGEMWARDAAAEPADGVMPLAATA